MVHREKTSRDIGHITENLQTTERILESSPMLDINSEMVAFSSIRYTPIMVVVPSVERSVIMERGQSIATLSPRTRGAKNTDVPISISVNDFSLISMSFWAMHLF